MAEYAKLSGSRQYYTGALAGQVYLKFLAYEGLHPVYTKDHKPSISISILGEENHHHSWSYSPKKVNQVEEVQIFLYHRSSRLEVKFHDAVTHEEIGTMLVEPMRMPNATLSTLWFKINDTAKVLVHAYWSALTVQEKFHSSPNDLRKSRFTLMTDRPFYVAGETVAGVVIYRPEQIKALSCVRLLAKGYSYQVSEGDFPDTTSHSFFTHKAILLGGGDSSAKVMEEYYIWSFNFPIPYNIPPSGVSAGNHYHFAVQEVEMDGSIHKERELFFGVRRVFFPRELLEPAIDQPPPKNNEIAPKPVFELPTDDAPKDHSRIQVSSVADASQLHHSAHVGKMIEDDDTTEDSEEAKPKTTKRKKSKKAESSSSPTGTSPRSSASSEDVSGESSDDSEEQAKPAKTEKPKKKLSKSAKAGPTTGGAESGDNKSDDGKSEDKSATKSDGETKKKKLRKSAKSANADATSNASQSPNISDDEGSPTDPKSPRRQNTEDMPRDGSSHRSRETTSVYTPKKPAVAGGTPEAVGSPAHGTAQPVSPRHKETRVFSRVKPHLRIHIQPSSGHKHLTLPVEIENTTAKPLTYFYVSLNYIEERLFRVDSSHQYSTAYRFPVKKVKFKDEKGWPLAVGAKWRGEVHLTLDESCPASVDVTYSPIFSRIYYAKVYAASKGVFSRHKISKKIVLLVGDYDWNTRPLPVQHTADTPIKFTIFSLPCGPYSVTFNSPGKTNAPLNASQADSLEVSDLIALDMSNSQLR